MESISQVSALIYRSSNEGTILLEWTSRSISYDSLQQEKGMHDNSNTQWLLGTCLEGLSAMLSLVGTLCTKTCKSSSAKCFHSPCTRQAWSKLLADPEHTIVEGGGVGGSGQSTTYRPCRTAPSAPVLSLQITISRPWISSLKVLTPANKRGSDGMIWGDSANIVYAPRAMDRTSSPIICESSLAFQDSSTSAGGAMSQS